MRTIYEDATMTAKRVRLLVKKGWPGVKFSVTCSKYSGGSSVHVEWNDGPMEKEVDAKIKGLQGADFDGMQDLKTQAGFLAMDGDEMVKIVGADFIFSVRHYSKELEAKILAEMQTYYDPQTYKQIMYGGYGGQMRESEQRLKAAGKL